MPSRKALVIGINEYPVKPLQYCKNDANEIGDILELQEYGFSVTKLIDTNATKRNILENLNKLFLDNPDFVLIYFSGHAISTDIGTMIVPIDFDSIEPGIDLNIIKSYITGRLSDKSSELILLD